MEEKELEFLNSFTEKLEKTVVDLCSTDELLDGKMLEVEELNEKWRSSAPSYMADAVPEIAKYPLVAIAWAMYEGTPQNTTLPRTASADGNWRFLSAS